MVVCKCKKATKLYCFVHKIPVCGDCICFPEHSICVVRTYSEWVIDGDYDWPSRCNVCRTELQDGTVTTRLGCLHVVHTNCLSTHLHSFPPHTAPAGYVCPTCATSIWPPKSIKDAGSVLYSKLKEAISKNDVGKILLGNSLAPGKRSESSATTQTPVTEINTISSVVPEPTSTTGASAMTAYDGSYPLVIGTDASAKTSSDIVEIDGAVSINLSPNASGPGATTRKGPYRGDRHNSHLSSRADDEDEIKQKYARRGSFHRKFLRFLLPFWSSALPTLPVTAPKKEERDAGTTADDDLHLRRRRSSVDPRKILLFIAILSCLATMMLLYYRLSQSNATNEVSEFEQQ